MTSLSYNFKFLAATVVITRWQTVTSHHTRCVVEFGLDHLLQAFQIRLGHGSRLH